MEKRDIDLPVMAPAYAHGVWNDVELMQTMILDHDVAHEHFRKETIECLEYGWGDGGHIFTASNAITRTVPKTNYLTMVNTYRKYFDLPEIIF